MNNTPQLIELVEDNKRVFVLLFSVLFGVISSESYAILKDQKTIKFHHFIPKIVVALFVCALCTPIIDGFKIKDKLYPYIIMLSACISMPMLDWLITDLVPSFLYTCKTVMLNILTKGKELRKERSDIDGK